MTLIGVNETFFPLISLELDQALHYCCSRLTIKLLLSLSWQSIHMHNSTSAKGLLARIIFHFDLLLHLCLVNQQD